MGAVDLRFSVFVVDVLVDVLVDTIVLHCNDSYDVDAGNGFDDTTIADERVFNSRVFGVDNLRTVDIQSIQLHCLQALNDCINDSAVIGACACCRV